MHLRRPRSPVRYTRRAGRPGPIFIGCLLAFLVPVWAPGPLRAETPASAPTKAPATAPAPASAPAPALTGSLRTEQGLGVLRLWGTPHEQGHAHGYLLGESIMAFLENVLLDPRLMPDPRVYEHVIRGQVLPRMTLTPAQREELLGLHAGLAARLGADRLRLQRLDRPLDVEDLLAFNTLADWVPFGCTSFAAWGSWSADGQMIIARNLDYIDLPGITTEHLLIARLEPGAGRRPFVSLAWPGMIGVYTGMNAAGVFVATHDAPALKAYQAEHLVARTLTLREILETVGPDDTAAAAEQILRRNPTLRGNNFMVAAPFRRQDVPAVVFEYDGVVTQEGGVTARTPACPQNNTPAGVLVCTNHYRARSAPVPTCDRYEAVRKRLAEWPADGPRLDARAALEVIRAAATTGTVHTVIALPNRGELVVHLASPGTRAPDNPGLTYRMEDLLKR